MAATALLRASHLLTLIHLQEPCFKEILDVLEHIHALCIMQKMYIIGQFLNSVIS